MSSEMAPTESDDQPSKLVPFQEKMLSRRNTTGTIKVPENMKLHDGSASFAEALKKVWKDCFSKKEQVKRQGSLPPGCATPDSMPSTPNTERVKQGEDLKDCSPRTLTRRMRFTQRQGSSVTEEDILHFAVSREDLKGVKKVLEHGRVDINFMRPPGVSVLHQACALGNLQIIEALLKYEADPNQRTWKGQSPLQIAARYGCFEAAELLVQAGADMNDIKDGLY